MQHTRTKHIAVHYHYTRQVVQDGTVLLKWIPTRNNSADIFTKGTISAVQHLRLMNAIGMRTYREGASEAVMWVTVSAVEGAGQSCRSKGCEGLLCPRYVVMHALIDLQRCLCPNPDQRYGWLGQSEEKPLESRCVYIRRSCLYLLSCHVDIAIRSRVKRTRFTTGGTVEHCLITAFVDPSSASATRPGHASSSSYSKGTAQVGTCTTYFTQ